MPALKDLLPASSYEEAKLHKLKTDAQKRSALKPPDTPTDWVLAIYRNIFSRPFGQQHLELFDWAWNVK